MSGAVFNVRTSFDGLAERLTRRAHLLAAARAEARRDPLRRWRRAALLWPFFAKG
jgi:hypothetical protein